MKYFNYKKILLSSLACLGIYPLTNMAYPLIMENNSYEHGITVVLASPCRLEGVFEICGEDKTGVAWTNAPGVYTKEKIGARGRGKEYQIYVPVGYTQGILDFSVYKNETLSKQATDKTKPYPTPSMPIGKFQVTASWINKGKDMHTTVSKIEGDYSRLSVEDKSGTIVISPWS